MPVFALPGGVVTILAPSAPNTGGNYVFEFYTDLTTGANLKKLVAVEKVEGQWQRTIDPISGYIEGYPLNADFTDMEFVMTYLGWQGITDADILGYITDGEAGGDGPPSEENHSPFDFTIIKEINLLKTEQLVNFAINHQDIWFQRVNISGKYIWALSVEVDDKNGTMEKTDNFIIDLNGSVYKGEFHDYWKQAFGVDVENNSTNWREDRFDANLNGVENLYRQYPEVQGTNARFPPIVRTKSVQSINGTEALFSGKVVSNGNNKNLTIGSQFSENIKFENSTEIILEAKPFEISYNFSNHGSKFLYYRAFAKNGKFESFGARKRIKIDLPVQPKIAGAEILEANWESSNWLGNYLAQQNGWIFHEDLGWCFLVVKKKNHWLWLEDHGWTWTTPSVWPYMYRNGTASWIYLLKRKSGPSLLFDQMNGQFMTIQK